MFIKSLTVSELGIFHNLKLLFCEDKINIVRGKNGCGKTTILAILYSMLQDSEILKYRCKENKAIINLEITDEERHFSLNKSYRYSCPEITIESFDEMKKLLSINRDRVYLLSGEFIGRKYKLDNSMIRNANNLFRGKWYRK